MEDNYTREELAFLIVILDAIVMLIFILSIWFAEFLIKLDISRHNNKLVECRQFACTFENLPQCTPNYTMANLKADLWDHILNNLSGEATIVDAHGHSQHLEDCEIVDIQFACNDYSYLESV